MTRLDSAEKWKKVTITLAELTPASATPGASLDLPATIEMRVVRSDASSSASGAVLLDSVTVALPAVRHDGGKYEADSWMGVATESVAEWAKVSIELAISLIGLMMLWLGLMKIAEEAGLVRLLARAVKPVMVFLFPDIPADSPAMGAILMNIAANMLGLGNAATPLGIKAMKEMQKDNPSSTYASNSQCMLLAVNTSSVIILPAGIIAYRAAQGSVELMKFWPVMLATTAISTTVAVVVCKLLEKLPIFAVPADALDNVGIAAQENDA
jgi:spore maturation protein A